MSVLWGLRVFEARIMFLKIKQRECITLRPTMQLVSHCAAALHATMMCSSWHCKESVGSISQSDTCSEILHALTNCIFDLICGNQTSATSHSSSCDDCFSILTAKC